MDHALSLGHNSSAEFTRPSDTNAYAAGDVVADSTSAATVMTFTAVTRGKKATAIIQEAILIDGANQSTKLDSELWLFDIAPASYGNDNAAFTPTDAELESLVGVIPFSSSDWKVGDATSGASGNCVNHAQNLSMVVNTTKDSSDLFGVLIARNAYTPVSAGTFHVRLKVLD